MGRILDLAGQRFGRLSVLELVGRRRRQSLWRCQCDCGKVHDTTGAQLRHHGQESCGCLQREAAARACVSRSTHGRTNTRLYNIWHSMKQRCEYPPHIVYENYGGRGIFVCREWSEAFEPFMEWAEANGYARNLSIDRIDSNGNYEPGNCRWATDKEQMNNRRSNRRVEIDGDTKTVSEWSDISGVRYSTLLYRIEAGKTSKEELFKRGRKGTGFK